MAHIFKHPGKDQKGIITLTHKEARFVFGNSKKKTLGWLKKAGDYPGDLASLKQSYFVGVHVGWLIDRPEYFDQFDFFLATESVVNQLHDKSSFVIPLRTRNFTPKVFSPEPPVPKFWDIICVSNNSKNKRLEAFLDSVKAIYDSGYKYKILLVSSERTNEKASTAFYNDLINDYNLKFSREERELFTIMRLSADLGFLALPQSTVAYLYRSSRVFTLFSALEGGPKVISEALMSGLPVVAYNQLQGGGLDYLTEKNSLLFDAYENAHLTLIDAVENYDRIMQTFPDHSEELGEEASLRQLKGYLSQLYEKHDMKFDGELINTDFLNLRLCAHINADIPWSLDRFGTADIGSEEQWKIFLSSLKYSPAS